MSGRGRGRGRGSRPLSAFAPRRAHNDATASTAMVHEPTYQVPPPPAALVEAAAKFLDCGILLGNMSPGALQELEEILAQCECVGEYYRGWANCASYSAHAAGTGLDPASPRHLPLILANRDKYAVVAQLGLSARVRYNPREETLMRPFPLAFVGETAGAARLVDVPRLGYAAKVQLTFDPDD